MEWQMRAMWSRYRISSIIARLLCVDGFEQSFRPNGNLAFIPRLHVAQGERALRKFILPDHDREVRAGTVSLLELALRPPATVVQITGDTRVSQGARQT